LPPADDLRILNVGTGSAQPLRNVVETLERVLQRFGLRPSLEFGRLPYRPDEPMLYAPEVSRLRQELDWVPETTIEDGLARTAAAALQTSMQ
jgi:nucleoside-diphosphate-sugar epimerase